MAEPEVDHLSATRARLHEIEPHGRRSLIEDLIAAHPDGRLVLHGLEDSRTNLRGVPLRDSRLRGAALAYADLHGADLAGANLSQSDLRFAALEGVDAQRADLSAADLQNANLGEANLSGALFEDATLQGASLRFANLKGAVFESAVLTAADFWGAGMSGADLSGVNARGALLGETRADDAVFVGADLRDVDFTDANLEKADLSRADLRGAAFRGANLKGANFGEAQLQGCDFSRANINGARWGGALLDHTRMGRDQVGVVGEELSGDWDAASRAYLVLERNFVELGDSAGSSWAYLRRRRMQKRSALADAGSALREGRLFSAARDGAAYLGDQAVEWVCDYGESLSRVFLTLGAVYVGFALLYGLVDGVRRVTSAGALTTTHNPLDLAVFSLMAMTTSGAASGMLTYANLYVALLSGLQALLGIFLTGLLGFVAGARIRR